MTIIVVKVVTFNDLQDQFNLPKKNIKNEYWHREHNYCRVNKLNFSTCLINGPRGRVRSLIISLHNKSYVFQAEWHDRNRVLIVLLHFTTHSTLLHTPLYYTLHFTTHSTLLHTPLYYTLLSREASSFLTRVCLVSYRI